MNNLKTIWDFFKSKGYSDYAIAGIVGNLFVESKLFSSNLQNKYNVSMKMTDAEYTKKVNNKTYSREKFENDKAGYGLCQWTHHSRKLALYDFMMNKYNCIDNFEGQLEFIEYELEHSYKKTMNNLKDATTIDAATEIFMKGYEQPAANKIETRIEYAKQAYNEYKFHKECAYIVNVSSYLNIRKEASASSDKIGKLEKGTQVYITKIQDNFGKLKDQDGWVSMDYLV